jgi:hypothetical protein
MPYTQGHYDVTYLVTTVTLHKRLHFANKFKHFEYGTSRLLLLTLKHAERIYVPSQICATGKNDLICMQH